MQRSLFIVAHPDDDLLFMNPDIQASIEGGRAVRTVFLTSGDACLNEDYWGDQRERGVMAAYAEMAGVVNHWTYSLADGPFAAAWAGRRPLIALHLAQRPNVSLVFFRIPSAKWVDGQQCDHGESLKSLWHGPNAMVTTVDGAAKYTKESLVLALGAQISSFVPDKVGTMNGIVHPDCTRPYECTVKNIVPMQDPPYRCDLPYDHADHYYSALFARAALSSYVVPHQARQYHGYSPALMSANVAGEARTRKWEAFKVHSLIDQYVPDEPTGDPIHAVWLDRQHYQDESHPEFDVDC